MPATPPDALLFIAPGCPHCPVVLQALSEMVKQGSIGRLEVINAAAHPEQAAALGVRAAPWTRLGPFELEGAQTPQELRRWLELAGQSDGITRYLEQLLRDGQLARAEQQLARHPDWLAHLLPLLTQADTPMQVRVGVGALIEGQAGSAELQALVPALGELSRATDHSVRADACHYLGLSGSAEAVPLLRARLEDENGDVREIAGEALDVLQQV
ncbi:HEAT repeat domain-containing protein [Sulfurivermis fontis]|uniref:HEAT repeat domain-containing protein n=1 Tax=Sulfurivermis fontis TaxID=1972068 RepID=UPI000FDBF587|nr:HEAT repeat domain-containing protein [Sulfurivermis fontis]